MARKVSRIVGLGSVRRFPVTLVMATALIVIAGVTGTQAGRLDPLIRRLVGFAPFNLWNLEWHRLVTSVFVTAGGRIFWISLFMLVASLAISESIFGSWRTLAGFWLVHLATLVLIGAGAAILLEVGDGAVGTAVFVARDVGPSAGYYGCLGMTCAIWARHSRMGAAGCGVAITVLVVRLGWAAGRLPDAPAGFHANLAHLLAFPLGMALTRWLPMLARTEGTGPSQLLRRSSRESR